jgi:flagellar biosynthesis protein
MIWTCNRYAWPAVNKMNPQRPQAIALSYHEGMYAPKVVAKGNGDIAEEIIRRAAEAGLYVHQSAGLVQLLMRIDLDEQIPQALYLAVAEILAWVRRLEAGAPPSTNPLKPS